MELLFIRPGKPIESAYVESLNGKLRDECLNQTRFTDLENAGTDRAMEDRLQRREAARVAGQLDPERICGEDNGVRSHVKRRP